jgi:hypothetical protein
MASDHLSPVLYFKPINISTDLDNWYAASSTGSGDQEFLLTQLRPLSFDHFHRRTLSAMIQGKREQEQEPEVRERKKRRKRTLHGGVILRV